MSKTSRAYFAVSAAALSAAPHLRLTLGSLGNVSLVVAGHLLKFWSQIQTNVCSRVDTHMLKPNSRIVLFYVRECCCGVSVDINLHDIYIYI